MPGARPTSHLSDQDGVLFESSEPQRTEAFLAATYSTPMKIGGDRNNYRFHLSRLGSGPLHINTVDHTANIDHRSDPIPAHVVVLRVLRGARTHVNYDEDLGPGDIAVLGQPGEPIHVRMSSVRYTAVVLPLEAVADAATNRPDEQLGPMRFDSFRPHSVAAARRWTQAVEYVSHNMRADPDAMTQPLLSGAAARLLAATMLATFPNTWVGAPASNDRADATPTTLGRAIEFIEANADLDIGLVDIARAAHVSTRAVQLAFRRLLDTTPMAYLRRVRLERAHEQLKAADPEDGVTVGQVAARWGFGDASRFAALYRNTYGQPPSQTLRN